MLKSINLFVSPGILWKSNVSVSVNTIRDDVTCVGDCKFRLGYFLPFLYSLLSTFEESLYAKTQLKQ